ncbi:MAG: lipoate--protein ligase [Lentisphaeria bacterium]|nr:lipoate--protein ligase [Lentisphaeria bacterium]
MTSPAARLKTAVYRLESLDIYRNLAAEECLFHELPSGHCRFVLWRSRPSVVIGKNQNPWRECHLPAMTAEGIRLARRISGGGAVYHDPGNLNFGFIVDSRHYDFDRQIQVVRNALQALGIDAVTGPRHILLAAGRKISGNAFYYRRNTALHHGTLLFDADPGRLRRCLQPTIDGIETRSIASHPVDTVNLRDLAPDLTLPQLEEKLIETFHLEYGDVDTYSVMHDGDCDAAAVDELQDKYAGAAWRFGMTAPFTLRLRHGDHATAVTAVLQIRKGSIESAEFSGAGAASLDGVATALEGCDFRTVALQDRLRVAGMAGSEFGDWLGALPGA